MFSRLSLKFLLKIKNEKQVKYVARCLHKTYKTLEQPRISKYRSESSYFSDSKFVNLVAGKGGDGCISFLQLWSNERAGPDGGDGGNGAHIIFQASSDVRNLNHVGNTIKAADGENGANNCCNGKNAPNVIVKVPVGTIVRDRNGKIVCDLHKENQSFVAARGGVGGKGNPYFANAKNNTPKICEYGPSGEIVSYRIELRSMADIGFIGCPNVGKSTLLNAISRATPKVAPYQFTTLRPHLGLVRYDDYEQLAVADLPGLIRDSHKNKGLGIQFLKHVERCSVLMFVLDISVDEPWDQYSLLMNELSQFSSKLATRPKMVVANKIDVEGSGERVAELEQRISHSVIPISAKERINIPHLLTKMREYYELHKAKGS